MSKPIKNKNNTKTWRTRKSRNETKRKYLDRSPTTFDNSKIKLRISRIDFDGRWGWNKVKDLDLLNAIYTKLCQFETMEWSELNKKHHHSVPTSKLHPDAQKRLEELHCDDNTLFSFKLQNKQRVWAIRVKDEAYILWWDPKHEICKSKLKHT